MNKQYFEAFTNPVDDVAPTPPLSAAETTQLRALLQIIRYDAPSKTLRIEHGDAKILLRANGSVRIEGRRIEQISQSAFVVNGASIELN